ncbi:MAG: hypothetical protein M1821_003063 [Bathelium mastoideum]|nr:MAG: hypothetical protein M1821_003063 [Bathelium mastoideum]
MPIVCLVTYSCGHYTHRRTERTEPSLESFPDEYLFPIDEVEAHDEHCGLDRCANMSRDKLSASLPPMINHAFDILTKLENQYEDMGRRFYLIRKAVFEFAEGNLDGSLLTTTEMAFDADLFTERDSLRSFLQKMLWNVEQELYGTRRSLSQDPSTALSNLNACRRLLCKVILEDTSIDRALAWLESIQRAKESNNEIEDEGIVAEMEHIRRARKWVNTLPEISRAVDNQILRSGQAVRTMFQPERRLEPDEKWWLHPLQDLLPFQITDRHRDLSWNTTGPLMPWLTWDPPVLSQPYGPVSEFDGTSLLHPELAALPLGPPNGPRRRPSSVIEEDLDLELPGYPEYATFVPGDGDQAPLEVSNVERRTSPNDLSLTEPPPPATVESVGTQTQDEFFSPGSGETAGAGPSGGAATRQADENPLQESRELAPYSVMAIRGGPTSYVSRGTQTDSTLARDAARTESDIFQMQSTVRVGTDSPSENADMTPVGDRLFWAELHESNPGVDFEIRLPSPDRSASDEVGEQAVELSDGDRDQLREFGDPGL